MLLCLAGMRQLQHPRRQQGLQWGLGRRVQPPWQPLHTLLYSSALPRPCRCRRRRRERLRAARPAPEGAGGAHQRRRPVCLARPLRHAGGGGQAQASPVPAALRSAINDHSLAACRPAALVCAPLSFQPASGPLLLAGCPHSATETPLPPPPAPAPTYKCRLLLFKYDGLEFVLQQEASLPAAASCLAFAGGTLYAGLASRWAV